MPIPLEVRYTAEGRSQRKRRTVIGVHCPTLCCLRLAEIGVLHAPVLGCVMGDVEVDWTQTSPGFEYWHREYHKAQVPRGETE